MGNSLLNYRLACYVADNILGKEQAGFRVGTVQFTTYLFYN